MQDRIPRVESRGNEPECAETLFLLRPRLENLASAEPFHITAPCLNRSCVVRTLKRTPFFQERFRIWLIMGATSRSGHGLGLASLFPTEGYGNREDYCGG